MRNEFVKLPGCVVDVGNVKRYSWVSSGLDYCEVPWLCLHWEPNYILISSSLIGLLPNQIRSDVISQKDQLVENKNIRIGPPV